MATQPHTQDAPTTKKQVRKPPLSDWPSIKVLNAPNGHRSQQRDQFCFTYCSQSIAGRASGNRPFCRSICFRKVYPHEVRNVVSFKQHPNVGPDGLAKYPLPPSGQPENIPRILGGSKQSSPSSSSSSSPSSSSTSSSSFTFDDEDEESSPPPPEKRHWEEGWYVWTASSLNGVAEQYNDMNKDLQGQQAQQRKMQEHHELWNQYAEYMRSHPDGPKPGPDGEPHRFWGPKRPERPASTEPFSTLMPFPTQSIPLSQRFQNLLTPTRKALEITRATIESGDHVEFARRVWEKAWTSEPYILAAKTVEKAGELWRERPDSDDDSDKDDRRRS